MTLEEERNRGTDAKAILENPSFQLAMSRLNDYLEAQAVACDPDNAEQARRIILSKQLMKGIERELYKLIEGGEVAVIELDELRRQQSRNKRLVR